MGVRTQNIKNLFTDARTRMVIIITGVVLLLAVITGYILFQRAIRGPAPKAAIESAPTFSSVPGSFNPTPQYANLVRRENALRAKRALEHGGSAIPTIVRELKPGTLEQVPGTKEPWQAGLSFKELTQVQPGIVPKGFILDAVKQSLCDKKDLENAIKSGANLTQLREAGCSAKQLEDSGFSPDQLQKAGFSACDLIGANEISPIAMKNAGYSAGELRGVGYNACQLKNAGFTPTELLKADFTPAELKGVGFTPQQIANAQSEMGVVTTPSLPSGVTPQSLRAAGCGFDAIQKAHTLGVSAATLKSIGCNVNELSAGGYTPKQLKEAGYTPGDLKGAGFTADQAKEAGFTPEELKKAGFATGELGPCSIAAIEKARRDGASVADLKKTGCTAGELKAAGIDAQRLKNADFTAPDLRSAGFDANQLKDAGFNPEQLKNAGLTAGELAQTGDTPSELKDAGFSAAQLKNAGFGDNDIKNAGYSPAELQIAGIPAPSIAGTTPATISPTAPKVIPPQPAVPTITTEESLQQQQIQAERMEQLKNQMQGLITGQINQLFTAWAAPQQNLVQGQMQTTAAAVAGSPGAAVSPTGTPGAPPLIKAGTILFAVLKTSINSDYPGPVLADVVTGPLNGARLIGSITTFGSHGQKVMISFDKLVLPDFPSSITINAVAIDPDTARTALSSYTNNHYLIKYGSLFASAFLEGYGQAFLQSGQVITAANGIVNITSPQLNSKGKLFAALGDVGNKFGSALSDLFNMPPTVHVYSGTSLGILFTEDVAAPTR